MMAKVYIYMILFAFLCVGYGCEQTDVNNGIEEQPLGDKIMLSSVSEPTGSETRAATNFPNGGNIGVIATTKLNDIYTDTDWTLYSDISNVAANAVSVTDGAYSFAWETQKYWPFDGSDLYFMAYSPRTTGNELAYLLSENNSALMIALQPNMPDVMYASNNAAAVPYNKDSAVVDLGEFRHALSQLTIEVIAGENLSPNIVVIDLSVITPARTASLYLPQGDSGLFVVNSEIEYIGTLISGITSLHNGDLVNSMLLFPGTEDVTEISITLLDTSNDISFTGKYMMSFFQNIIPTEPITLKRAKNTVLQMTVDLSDVQNPSETVELRGSISDWTYGGKFGIGIN